jgi:DNA sulfur modification protein DndB
MAGRKVDSEGALESLLEGDALRVAFRRRRDENEYAKIPFDKENKFTQEEWIVHKRTQSHLWMKKQKPPEALLEDRVWCLLYRMGYPRLSGPKFIVPLESGSSGSDAKRISVMAIDDETAIVIDCRARQNRGRRNFQKEIQELEGCKRKISSAIRNSSAKGFNPKIVWMLATSNIIWAEKDVERAEAANIRIITENEIQYFEAFVAHIGTAGRYQFLAEFLEGQEIPNLQNVRVPAVKGRFRDSES